MGTADRNGTTDRNGATDRSVLLGKPAQTASPQKAAALRQRGVTRARPQVEACHCLVASARPSRNQWLAETARRWGWDVSVCDSPIEAQRALVRYSPQLAFVDLEGPEGEAFFALAAKIARECMTLLVVCGNEGDIKEETWTRELGVWFYLPGMTPGASVGLLFRDARTIVEKRGGRFSESPCSEEFVD